MSPAKPSLASTELQIALDNRAFEIQLFWQRSNYFLVLMTALGIGAFAIDDPKYALMISIFSSTTSWYWYKTNLGSKFWHESWEVEVVHLAKEQGIRSFERPTADLIEQVRRSLEDASSSGGRNWLRRWIDKQILKKPSVSHYMILLSLTSTILWSIVSISYAYDFLSSSFDQTARGETPARSAVRERIGPSRQEPPTNLEEAPDDVHYREAIRVSQTNSNASKSDK